MSKTKAVDSTILFSKTAPLKLFFIAAVPGAISMFASALYQTIDGVFVGRFLRQTAFAAINLAMPFVIINFSLADLIGVGSAVPISVCLGKKQEREANTIFTCACLMIVGAGAVIGGILFAAAPLLIRLMGGRKASSLTWRCSICGYMRSVRRLPPSFMQRITSCASVDSSGEASS